jgi:hypothetical protein
MSTTSRKIKILVVILIICILIAKFAIPWDRFGDQKARAQEIRMYYSNEPGMMVDEFLKALIENNLKLAKELVIPEQQERIDKWKAESKHKAFECPYMWKWILSDPLQTTAWGGRGETEFDDKTREIDITYGCSFNNRKMSVEKVVVKFDGSVWIITNWEMICETPPAYGEEEICYR